MKTYLVGGKIYTPHQVVDKATIVINNGKIDRITNEIIEYENDANVINVHGFHVAPGYIDIHIHGAMGVSMMDASPDAIHNISRYIAKHGVTSFLPTTWSATPELTYSTLESLAKTAQIKDGAQHLGAHIEGPYLNLEFRGAQLPGLIRNPDVNEYRNWFESDLVRLITFAPENKGSLEFVQEGLERGVEFAIGHTGASYEQVVEAANLGVRQATHVFNGMQGLHHRNPGTVGGILDDNRIFAQLICDGIHLHPAVVRLLIKAKGTSRVILITDSIRGAGLEDGDYNFAGLEIIVRDGIARTPAGGLSGSTLTMDKAIRNAMEFTSLPFEDILPMATSVPAEAMGWQDRIGSIKPGADADIIILDDEFNVQRTMIAGNFIN